MPIPISTRPGAKRYSDACRVALVAMPFASIVRPSIQIGLLKAISRAHGFHADSYHLSLDFAKAIGASLYESLAQHRGPQFGDWLFSMAAFRDAAPDRGLGILDEFQPETAELLAGAKIGIADLRRIREETVPRFIEEMLRAVSWQQYGVVGFSSTFQQNVSSLALARCIKETHPDAVVVFGGANFDGEMGTAFIEAIPWIDYAISGEADLAWPMLLSALSRNEDPSLIQGVLSRTQGSPMRPHAIGANPVIDLDSSPLPDYDEYFERAEALGLLSPSGRREVDLPFESARGCWWGERSHCTFCGLNRDSMRFRSKSKATVKHELAALTERYRTFHFSAVDNIMDIGYVRGLLPELAAEGADYRLFYEVKANLTRDDVRGFSEAGVAAIQPGIESLSSHVLRLMRKGVRAIQNVNLLRWCRFYEVACAWNILWGFPGETESDYQAQAALIPQLTHLPPPCAVSRIWLERFSPLFVQREALLHVRPEKSYEYVYPTNVNLERAAYFFDFTLRDELLPSVYEGTARAAAAWQEAWKDGSAKPSLTYWSAPAILVVEDARNSASGGSFTFRPPLSAMYVFCSDRPMSAQRVREECAPEYSLVEVESALDEFCAIGIMMRDEGLFLSLALPASRR